jgi:cytochrome oxidase Cu insertion factor (SCO1/SenC/PrrC family)
MVMSTLARTGPLLFLALTAGCLREAGTGTEPTGLRVGRAAPEVEGIDADGRPFRLSDYRGRVVLLHFWRAG